MKLSYGQTGNNNLESCPPLVFSLNKLSPLFTTPLLSFLFFTISHFLIISCVTEASMFAMLLLSLVWVICLHSCVPLMFIHEDCLPCLILSHRCMLITYYIKTITLGNQSECLHLV